MTPSWRQLLLDLDEVDALRLLASWSWLIDRSVVPVALSRFGDWFLSDSDQHVFRLDILEGAFEPICDSVDQFHRLRSGDLELDDWFQEGMVSSLYRVGMVPGRGEGFGYKLPPVLGGSCERENVVVVKMAPWQIFMAQVHEQVRDLPPGTRIREVSSTPEGRVWLRYESS